MSEYQKLKDEFETKVRKLRFDCPHKELSDWVEYHWAIGHISGYVRYCKRCEEIIDRKNHL